MSVEDRGIDVPIYIYIYICIDIGVSCLDCMFMYTMLAGARRCSCNIVMRPQKDGAQNLHARLTCISSWPSDEDLDYTIRYVEPNTEGEKMCKHNCP